MESSFTLGRIAGIRVGIHYTWLFAFFLVTWSLAEGFFPSNYRGWSATLYWGVGALAALALFASVLVHELSHSFVARARGIGVDSITLFIFGGVSNLKTDSEEPRDEFLISVVGPLTSFALGGLAWLADQALRPGDGPLGAVLSYLALINLMLGAFNLIPGFPLDGGRVLRSIIWGITHNMRRATDVASYVGQAFGFVMIFWGVSQVFGGHLLNGLWTAFIGWFLNNAAEATRRSVTEHESLRGVKVSALMDPSPPIAGPDLTVQDFVFDYVIRRGRRALLVADGGRLLGIVSISDAKHLPQDAWATTPIGRIMTSTPLKTLAPAAELSGALGLLVEGELNQLPVVEDGKLVGLLSRSDVLRFMRLRDELHLGRAPAATS